MPNMSGLEIIERLRAEGQTIPAIVITGNGDVGMAVKAMKAGAIDFIEKPANARDLLASIDFALNADHGSWNCHPQYIWQRNCRWQD